jgi:SAM-dependent methyltransferase
MPDGGANARPEFWDARYASGQTPWDFGGAPAALGRFLARTPSPGRVLIPGCGSGYEVRAFHEAGAEVVALDFSAGAVSRARSLLGPLARCVLHGDFFLHDFGEARFDLVYERTFLCALEPARRPSYARRMAEVLRPGGRLVGTFLYGREPEPPPYPMTREESGALLGGGFRLGREEAVGDSLPVFDGMEERWQEWVREA